MNTAVDALKKSLPAREEFGASMPIQASANPLATAREAEAKAAVEARYIMAMRNRRNWDEVRQKILKECHRPSFAKDKSALYRKPVGAGVEGLGIRFAEMAMRCMTNVMTETPVIYEDETRRVIRVIVTNLEDNQTEFADVTVSKTVERAKPMDDGSYISVRMNTYGKPTYTVPATDEDLLNKEWALVSKMRRNCSLRHIPGDIQAEAEEIIRAVRADEAAKDPDAERREIADGFAKLNIPVDELTEYVGHDLGTCSPKELADLRTVWGSVRDGEATWASLLEHHRGGGAKGAQTTKPGKGVDAMKEKIKSATTNAQPKTEAAANPASNQAESAAHAPVAGAPAASVPGKTEPLDWITSLDKFTDVELMELWVGGDVPEAVRNDERFIKAHKARQEALTKKIDQRAQEPDAQNSRNAGLFPAGTQAAPEITAIDAIAAFAGISNIDKLDEFMDQLPMPVKQDERVTKKFAVRRDELKAAAGKSRK